MTDAKDAQQQNVDTIYASPQTLVQPFEFNHSVAAVFDDMIQRSVPGYALNIDLIALVAKQYAQPGSHLYDLGCSSGRATLALAKASPATCRIIGVDQSSAMIDQCTTALETTPEWPRIALRCEDLLETEFSNASVIVLNYTLQFLAVTVRDALVQTLFAALRPGGVLLVAEKTAESDFQQQQVLTELHLNFKRSAGYSELEIAQKRTALERVLVPETEQQHLDRFQRAGFETVATLSKAINFCGFIAIRSKD